MIILYLLRLRISRRYSISNWHFVDKFHIISKEIELLYARSVRIS